MSSRIFFWNILARVGLIIGTSFLFIWFTERSGEEIIFILLTGTFLIALQVLLLTRYALGITRIVEQFIESIGREESPEVQFGTGRTLFRRLKERSNVIKEALNARRLEKEKDERILVHVINSADQGLFCFSESGEVVFVNQSALNLISSSSLTHVDEIASLNPKLWEVLRGLRPGSPRVLRLGPWSRKGGARDTDQLLSVRLKEIKIFDETYKLFTLQNIQEELHKNESDSWQKIIRVLTHEIMNAVAPMLSLSKSLQNKAQNASNFDLAKIAEGLRMIENTGQGLMDFTEEYRRLSLMPPPKKKKIRLNETLKGIALFIETETGKRNIQVDVLTDDPEKEISADPQQFEMVLLNLLRNAMDSFPEEQEDKRVIIRSLKKGDGILVQVEDNGSGIAPELIDQVFVPFFSTKERGSGIGLSLSRQIMNNHQGSILIDSEPGEHTLVTLVFPRP